MELFEHPVVEQIPFRGEIESPVGRLELGLTVDGFDTTETGPVASGLSNRGVQVAQWKSAGLRAELIVRQFEPEIIQGLDYDRCLGAIWRVSVESDFSTLEASLQMCRNGRGEGGVDTGEGLDAQSWLIDGHVISIGTENARALRYRAKNGQYMPARFDVPVKYHEGYVVDDGLCVSLGSIESGDSIQVAFAASWVVSDDPNYCGPWMAVDRTLYAIRQHLAPSGSER